MDFAVKYACLSKNTFAKGEFSIVPVRYQDRFEIMKWRNEQLYHLRQVKPLSPQDQENYFSTTVAGLFEKERPEQVLFSYLKNETCIGYGGLVHINWIDRNAEISFIMKTELEEKEFQKHWSIYLELIEQAAFRELKLHKIYTYAFDLRPHLYEALEANFYTKEAVLKHHCCFNGLYKDVVIHAKINDPVTIRPLGEADKQLTFTWANDPLTRQNSFQTAPILFEEHSKWFDAKMQDQKAYYFIGEVGSHPAGLIRFDFDTSENACIAGITLDRRFRGRNLGVEFLKMACIELSKCVETAIIAYIKKDNAASIKIFEKAGFVFLSGIVINHSKSLKYRFQAAK